MSDLNNGSDADNDRGTCAPTLGARGTGDQRGYPSVPPTDRKRLKGGESAPPSEAAINSEPIPKLEFIRIHESHLPFDRTHLDPSKNYGIRRTYLKFILKNDLGAVQYLLMIPHIDKNDWPSWTEGTMGLDVGYHSPKPMYEGQNPMDCDLFGRCYYEGSTLRAEEWTEKIFSVRGERSEVLLWEMLEQEHARIFGGKK